MVPLCQRKGMNKEQVVSLFRAVEFQFRPPMSKSLCKMTDLTKERLVVCDNDETIFGLPCVDKFGQHDTFEYEGVVSHDSNSSVDVSSYLRVSVTKVLGFIHMVIRL